MNHLAHGRTRAGRLVYTVALTTVLLLGASACGGDDPGSGKDSGSTAPAPDAKKALTALNAGLKAHADGDLETATADYDKALTYEPTNKYAFYNLALIDETNGNYGLAEQKYRSALETDPKYEPALFNLAILRTARNDPTEAIELYKRAVAADKKDASAWLNLGLLLRKTGEKEAGDEAVLRAIALNPSLKDPEQPVDGNGPTTP